jgi:hypothetical protein
MTFCGYWSQGSFISAYQYFLSVAVIAMALYFGRDSPNRIVPKSRRFFGNSIMKGAVINGFSYAAFLAYLSCSER